jgi:8-oxo-dGTP pyrophosphatase MutT (NUDIX family)
MGLSPQSEEVVYRGHLIEIVHTVVSTSSGTQTFETARRGPGTRVIFDRGDSILITREYRYELSAYDLRLPGGKVFDTLKDYEAFLIDGESEIDVARTAARREGREEVGLDAEDLQHLAISVCGATIKWDLYYFAAMEWTEVPGGPKLEQGEQISFSWLPKEEVMRAALDGRISEERSALQLMRYLQHRETQSRG